MQSTSRLSTTVSNLSLYTVFLTCILLQKLVGLLQWPKRVDTTKQYPAQTNLMHQVSSISLKYAKI